MLISASKSAEGESLATGASDQALYMLNQMQKYRTRCSTSVGFQWKKGQPKSDLRSAESVLAARAAAAAAAAYVVHVNFPCRPLIRGAHCPADSN